MGFSAAEYVVMGLAAASAATAAYGSYEQGQSQEAMNRYQAAVATNNQTIANQYAEAEVQKGQALEQQKRMQTSQQEGAVRAAAASGGLALDSGSPLRLQEDTAKLGELDAQTIRYNANAAAYGYKVQGLNFAAQAEANEMAASNAATAGTLGMWSSIIGGASSVSGKWVQYKQAGTSKAGPFSG